MRLVNILAERTVMCQAHISRVPTAVKDSVVYTLRFEHLVYLELWVQIPFMTLAPKSCEFS